MSGEDIRFVVSSVVTFLAGYFLHVLKSRREDRAAKDARKDAAESARKGRIREFKGFMGKFRSWVERSSLGQIGDGFHSQINDFRGEVGRIEDDVPAHSRDSFNQAVTALCRLTGSQVTQYEIITDDRNQNHVNDIGRNRLADAIDEVRKAVE